MAPKLAEMSLPLVEAGTAGVKANQRWGDGGVPANPASERGRAHPGSAGVVRSAVSGVGHDAVVGAAGAGAAGAGAVAAEHLRGGPAVEFHQVALGAAAV